MRLTNVMRDDMQFAIIEHAFKAKREAMQKRELELSVRAYHDIFTAEERKAMQKLAKASGDRARSYFHIIDSERNNRYRSYDQIFRVNANGYQVALTLPDGSLLPYATPNQHGVISNTQLAEELVDFINAKEHLDTEVRERSHEVRAVLDSCSSDRKLAEIWPDAMPVVRKVIKEFAPTQGIVPMLVISNLNASLGLPPSDDEDDLKDAA